MHHRLIRVWLGVSLVAVAMTGPSAPAQAPALPADLAIVHPDALGFVHVRLADVWKHESLADARMLAEKAGPKALAALDAMFVPKPSTADRVTTVILPPGEDSPEPQFVFALRFTEPFDQAKTVQSYCPGAKAKMAGGKEYFAEEQGSGSIYFPDDRTLVFGPGATLESYLTWAPKADGGLTPAIALAAAGKSPMVAAVNVATLPLPPGAKEQVPPDFRPLMRTRLVIATMDLADRVTLTMKLTYTDPDAAAEGERALKAAAKLGRSQLQALKAEPEKALYGGDPAVDGVRPIGDLPMAVAAVAAIGAVNYADEILADLPVVRDGNTLAASVTLPPWMTQYLGTSVMSAGLMLPAVQKVREAAARAKSTNNLKQIAIAMHAYHDANGAMPPAAIVDKKTGKPLLSWRVAILPYVEQGHLYEQFKLDEPWDSPANLRAASYLPPVYADPRMPAKFKKIGGEIGKPEMPDMTYYKVFTGKDTAFPDTGKGVQLHRIADGTSNTIMAVSGGDPVIWTKPDDIPFDPKKPLPDLSKPFDILLVAMCDGSVRAIVWKSLDEATRKNLIMASDGNPVYIP